MSKPIKLLVLLFIVALLAAVVLTMLGKPPNLPLGPLQGVLAKEEEPIDDGGIGGTDATPIDTNPCPPGQILGSGATGTGATGTGATGTDATGAGATGTAGAATGTGAAGTDAAAAGATDATAGGTGVDPATGAPIATPTGAAMVGVADRSWDGEPRILAAGDGGDDRVSDTMMVADATPSAAPAATDATAGTIDPTTGAAAGVAADATGAANPAATDSAAAAAAGATAANCVPDPNAGTGGTGGTGTGTATTPTTPSTGGTGTGTGSTGGTGTPSTGGTGTTPAAKASTTDGTNMGNSPEALRMAQDITGVMQQAKITVSVTATLVPATGGTGPATAQKFYRSRVTGAVLVIKLTDQTAVQQWTSAGKAVQTQLVKSFIQRLGKTYPKAVRAISVVDSSGNLLAVGDAAVGGGAKAGTVKLY